MYLIILSIFFLDDENVIPDLCYTNYNTIQVIQGKIFVFEEEVRLFNTRQIFN